MCHFPTRANGHSFVSMSPPPEGTKINLCTPKAFIGGCQSWFYPSNKPFNLFFLAKKILLYASLRIFFLGCIYLTSSATPMFPCLLLTCCSLLKSLIWSAGCLVTPSIIFLSSDTRVVSFASRKSVWKDGKGRKKRKRLKCRTKEKRKINCVNETRTQHIIFFKETITACLAHKKGDLFSNCPTRSTFQNPPSSTQETLKVEACPLKAPLFIPRAAHAGPVPALAGSLPYQLLAADHQEHVHGEAREEGGARRCSEGRRESGSERSFDFSFSLFWFFSLVLVQWFLAAEEGKSKLFFFSGVGTTGDVRSGISRSNAKHLFKKCVW